MEFNRTHYLGNLGKDNIDQEVVVMGWIKKHRDLGEIIFMDIRDYTGFSQVVVNNNNAKFKEVQSFKQEYVVEVKGYVKQRQDVNDKIKTGMIEIIAREINLINRSIAVPFNIVDDVESSEDTRLKYRFLDLRRDYVQNSLRVRHKVTRSVRDFLDNNLFCEIETPILTKKTPEGARDYLVPSRVNLNKFYALPQSPQIYKNLLMVGGIDRYYQIAKCFRDEDLRSDRQPEFTQIDIEMSFMKQDAIMDLVERMLKKIVLDVKGIEINHKFDIMDYDDAMNLYGSDKPDTRFGLLINDITSIFSESEFNVFKNAKYVKAIKVVNEASNYSRKKIDKLEEVAKNNHAKGLAFLKYIDGEFSGSVAKFLNEKELSNLKESLDIKENDLLLIVADEFSIVSSSLGAVRLHLGNELDLIDENSLNFLWVVNWPLFEFDEEANRYVAVHHPFTMPVDNKFNDDIITTRAQAYDIVLNGYEIGGGSIRINNEVLLNKMFSILGMDQEEIDNNFKFLIDAYKYGAPYHGGLALGLDRIVMILLNTENIKDVIAFPKNNKAIEIMLDSPTFIDDVSLEELSIKVLGENND